MFCKFIDLVKAFDFVPRGALFAVLSKFGTPEKLCNLICKLHTGLKVKFSVDSAEAVVDSTVGVKQGDSLAPTLFVFFIQAAVETIDAEWSAKRPSFCTIFDGTLHGRRWNAKRGAIFFEVLYSLYADGGAFLMESRSELISGMRLIFEQLKRFGLTCHVGRDGKKAKTEAMLFPANSSTYDQYDTSDFIVGGGTVHFCSQFRYLGSWVSSDLCDDHDIDARIQSAGAAFGFLRRPFFASRRVPHQHKKLAFEGLILSILLYGSEAWTVSARTRKRLQNFFNRCARTMCRVTRWHTWKQRISQRTLEKRIGLRTFSQYLHRRQLRWIGHVARMETTRLPRRLLTSWVAHPRPKGRPKLNYGQYSARLLKGIGLSATAWLDATVDRNLWDLRLKSTL